MMESNLKEITNYQNNNTGTTETDRSVSNIQADPSSPGRNCSFYITNLESYLNKEKVTKEFSYYGEIKEVCVKKSSYTRYYLAYIKLGNVKKSTDEIISVLYKRHGWKISLYYKEEIENDKDKDKEKEKNKNKHKKVKRHICGKKNEKGKSRSKEKNRDKSRSRSRIRFSPRKDKENSNSNLNSNNLLSLQNTNEKIKNSSIPLENQNLKISVREIYASNLPSSYHEQDIWNIFFIHGEIDRIEYSSEKRHAYIKYFLISSALKALQKENDKYYRGYYIRVSPCEATKRKDIMGDKPNYQVSENNCTIIHVNLSSNCKISSESSIKDLFSTYGKIKAWNICKDPPHVYIQYERIEDAKEAIKRLMNLDASSTEKRKLIGDAKCNISSYYSEKKLEDNQLPVGQNIGTAHQNGLGLVMNQNNLSTQNLQNLATQINSVNPSIGSVQNPSIDLILQMQQSPIFNNQILSMFGNIPNLGNLQNFPQSFADALNLLKIFQVMNPTGLLQQQSPGNVITPQITPQALNSGNNINILNNQVNQGINSGMNPGSLINNLQSSANFSNFSNFTNLQNMNSLIYNGNLTSPNQISTSNSSESTLSYIPNIQNPIFNQSNNITPVSLPNIHVQGNSMNSGNGKSNNLKNGHNLNGHKSNFDLEMEKTKNFNNSNISNNLEKTSASYASSMSMQNSVTGINPLTTQFENEYSLESENLKIIWSGDLSKNNKNKVGVIAYQIRCDCEKFLNQDFSLNVEQRTSYDDVIRRRHKGMVVFSPQNETQMAAFDEFVNYFRDRQRVGLINLKNNTDTIYFMAPCELSNKFYRNPKKHLLGIFVDRKHTSSDVNDEQQILGNQNQNSQNGAKTTNVSGNGSVRGNLNPLSALIPNVVSFPPAVISLAEKKLMNEQSEKKKNSQNLQNSNFEKNK